MGLGLGSFIGVSRDRRLILDVGLEFLDDDVIDSPIVGEERVIQGFSALNYVF